MSSYCIDVNASNFDRVVIEGSKAAPVIVDFWAPWCAPCRALTPVLEKLAAEYQGRFTLAKVNSDENQEVAAQFGAAYDRYRQTTPAFFPHLRPSAP